MSKQQKVYKIDG